MLCGHPWLFCGLLRFLSDSQCLHRSSSKKLPMWLHVQVFNGGWREESGGGLGGVYDTVGSRNRTRPSHPVLMAVGAWAESGAGKN